MDSRPPPPADPLADFGLRTLWESEARTTIAILDQTQLPAAEVHVTLASVADAARAIRSMQVRGAPLIGVTAAYGLALALRTDPSDASLQAAYSLLLATRPTAVNLRWALDRVRSAVVGRPAAVRAAESWQLAHDMAAEDVATNRAIGEHGLGLLERAANEGPVQILTHCNAGALATLGWGTATAPIYRAQASGLPLHVWVSETRPRLQGARLTAYELGRRGVAHTLIVDAAGAAMMQRGRVDIVLVGADRVTRDGDVCNKIGTYEKALAARDNDVPFYVAVPSSTIDWSLESANDIRIEERHGDELLLMSGDVIAPAGTRVANPAFDITPARLVTGLITERGLCAATRDGIAALYPEHRR